MGAAVPGKDYYPVIDANVNITGMGSECELGSDRIVWRYHSEISNT